MRLNATVTALALVGLSLAACSGSTTSTNDAGPTTTCTTARDCATIDPTDCRAPKVCVCSNQICVPVCQLNSDCQNSQICVDGTCSNPGCGGDSDCHTAGQVCLGGACGPAPTASAIHSCTVTPASGVVHAGNTYQMTAVGADSAGNAVPFRGVTWSATGAATIDASTGLLTAGSAAGSSTVTATFSGSVSCNAAMTVYAAAASGSLRTLVVDEDTKNPVAGAFVVLDSDTAHPQTSGSDGTATFTVASGSGAHNVHVFAHNYNYTSFIGVTGNDIIVPVRQFYPIAQRAPWNGTITTADFANLTETGQIVHVGFFGSGISGSLLDFSLDDLLGKRRTVTINLGGSQTIPNMPGGLVLGVGNDLYGTGSYSMYSDPGERILWGIGGNIDINTVLTIASPIINGGGANIDIGALLPQVLPLLGNLETGAVMGVQTGASVATGTPTGATQSVTLDTPMRLNVAAKSPNLPQFNGDYVDGVIAVTGAAAFPMGFTPLGVTAGLAAKDANGAKTGAILDPTCTASASVNCATNSLPLKMSTRNHGLEVYPFSTILLGLNFASLTSGTGGTIAVSGLVQNEDAIAFSGGTSPPTVLDLTTGGQTFMKLPASANTVSYSTGTRTVAITADADTAVQLYRFTMQNVAHQGWAIYMAPAGNSGSTAVLINPTDVDASLSDIQVGGTGFVTAVTTDSASNTYATMTGGGNVRVDDFGNHLKEFAVQTVTLGN